MKIVLEEPDLLEAVKEYIQRSGKVAFPFGSHNCSFHFISQRVGLVGNKGKFSVEVEIVGTDSPDAASGEQPMEKK